ncbi:hypothetical protein ACHAW6_010136 [Cyclotella cf. meneghiniana]
MTTPLTEDVSIAPTDASVAGSSVAVTEAEEDATSYAARKSYNEFTLPTNLVRGDVSIAPTEASVAGSSVAATEAEEDAASYAAVGGNIATLEEVILTNISIPEVEEQDVAPMHLHVLRTPAKLKGVAPASGGRRSRSSSRSRPGSRRNSASPRRPGMDSPTGGSFKGLPGDAASLASSLEDEVDPDIFLDRFGLYDLDPKLTQEEFQELLKKHLSGGNSLPTLNERMSEETLEDVHAFQDLVFVRKKSSGSLMAPNTESGSLEEAESADAVAEIANNRASLTIFSGLEALNEEEEDEEDDDHAGPDASQEENEDVLADQSPASSLSGEDLHLADSDIHEEETRDVVVELPDPSMIQKDHDSAALKQDSSVMAVEDRSDNEELNLEDQEVEGGIVLPTSIMEELRISDECRLKGQKSREFDTTEGEDEEDCKVVSESR